MKSGLHRVMMLLFAFLIGACSFSAKSDPTGGRGERVVDTSIGNWKECLKRRAGKSCALAC